MLWEEGYLPLGHHHNNPHHVDQVVHSQHHLLHYHPSSASSPTIILTNGSTHEGMTAVSHGGDTGLNNPHAGMTTPPNSSKNETSSNHSNSSSSENRCSDSNKKKRKWTNLQNFFSCILWVLVSCSAYIFLSNSKLKDCDSDIFSVTASVWPQKFRLWLPRKVHVSLSSSLGIN